MNEKIKVAGIAVSAHCSIDDMIRKDILIDNVVKPGIAVAINPEKIMLSIKDESIFNILQKATLKYPDGIGVSYVMNKKSGHHVARIPGCELWEQLMLTSVHNKIPVFLVGASKETLIKTKNKLIENGVNIVGEKDGYFTPEEESSLISEIKNSGAKIVSVALGSPKQELFIFECVKHIPDAFFMGVGGTYDVYTGSVKRAPRLFRKLKCEWLFRLLSQPTRINRQVNLIKYLILYLRGKL